MLKFKSISIRNNIIALIILMTLVPFSFMVYSLVVEREHQVREAIRESAIHAEQTAKLIDQITGSTELLLNMLSRLPIIQTGDEKAVNSFLLDLVKQYPQYSSFFIVDTSGRRWATTNQLSGTVSYRDRRYFSHALSSGHFSSGEYAIGKVKKKPVFSFGLPVKNSSGTISGVAVATIELAGLKTLLQKQIIHDRMSVIVMDHQGKILLHSSKSALEGTQTYEPVYRRILHGVQEATIETDGNNSADRKLLTYKKLYIDGEKSPYMYVVIEADKKALLNEPNRKFALNLTILLILLFLSLTVAYRTSKRFMLDKVDESEQRHRILFETSPQGIIYQNTDGAIISANPIAEALFGQAGAARTPGEYPLYIHEDGTPYPVETHPAMLALSTGKPVSNVIMGVVRSSSDTHRTWLKIDSIPMFNKAEKVPYMVYSMFDDITKQRELERERLEIEHQMLQAQKLESLGVMAGGIAHDFNNLLHVIHGNLELASIRIDTDSATKKLLANAMLSSKQAAHLTGLMLAYVGKGSINKKQIDLNLLVNENADMFRSAATPSFSFELFLSDDLPAIFADQAQIQQVIMNLITNASEAIDKQPGYIRITSGIQHCSQTDLAGSLLKEKPEPGRYVFLEVRDNGCGMNHETIERLFDPFFTTKFTGRGLGMSAVMGILKAHAGALFVESEIGNGTIFRVLFPVSETAQAAEIQNSYTSSNETATTLENRLSGLVLVVDDDKSVLRTCTKMVNLCGFNVVTAFDGIDGVAKFREHADIIDLVIMDLTMPNMDGITAMTEIRRIKTDCKIILASGYNEGNLDDRFKSLQAPSGFIRKPYCMKELETELQRVSVEQTGQG